MSIRNIFLHVLDASSHFDIFPCVKSKIIKPMFFFFWHVSAYDAQVAGLYYGVNNTDYGFQVLYFFYILLYAIGGTFHSLSTILIAGGIWKE